MARNDKRRTGAKPAPRGFRLFMRRVIVWGGALTLFSLLSLTIAVAREYQQLPDFNALKASQNEQMIVVRARDGTELVTIGPSYGKWLPAEQIPQVMKDAILSTEDKRYYQHIGVDPWGVLRSIYKRVPPDAPLAPNPVPVHCQRDCPAH